jgi:hypothetical protein
MQKVNVGANEVATPITIAGGSSEIAKKIPPQLPAVQKFRYSKWRISSLAFAILKRATIIKNVAVSNIDSDVIRNTS